MEIGWFEGGGEEGGPARVGWRGEGERVSWTQRDKLRDDPLLATIPREDHDEVDVEAIARTPPDSQSDQRSVDSNRCDRKR